MKRITCVFLKNPIKIRGVKVKIFADYFVRQFVAIIVFDILNDLSYGFVVLFLLLLL